MRAAVTALITLAILWSLTPTTDCTGLTSTQCERARLIDAGAID